MSNQRFGKYDIFIIISELTHDEQMEAIDAVKMYENGDKNWRSKIVGNVKYVWPALKQWSDWIKEHEDPKYIRNSPQYKEWRTRVFERDGYTCRYCGKKGGSLNAHHIKEFKKYPDMRLDVSNGVTLCYDCHRAAHRHEISIEV